MISNRRNRMHLLTLVSPGGGGVKPNFGFWGLKFGISLDLPYL